MKRLIFLISIGFFLFSQVTYAQRMMREGNKERWEKYRSEKIAFLTSNLDLSPEEAQKFWPVYNQMEKEKSEMQQNRHDLERKVQDAAESLSDVEIVKLTREYAGSMEKEGALNIKYNEEFLKILPPKKVLKIYKVEREFRMHMFNKYRDQHKKK